MGGLGPGLGTVDGSPGPLRGHTSRLRSFWGGCWNEPVAVPAQWQEGSRCAFLMASTRGRLLVLGGNPVHGSDALDSRMGTCLWDLSLGRTGDARLMGKHFRVCCWFFSWGGGGGEEEAPGQVLLSRFRRTTRAFKQPHVYVLYYPLSSGGFAAACFRPSRKVPSILDALGSARALFRLRRPVDLFTHQRR